MSSRVGLEEPASPPWISTPRPHASSNDTVFQVGPGCLGTKVKLVKFAEQQPGRRWTEVGRAKSNEERVSRQECGGELHVEGEKCRR